MTDPQNTEKVALTDAEKDAIEWANFGEPNCELEDAVEAIIEARRAADLRQVADDIARCADGGWTPGQIATALNNRAIQAEPSSLPPVEEKS